MIDIERAIAIARSLEEKSDASFEYDTSVFAFTDPERDLAGFAMSTHKLVWDVVEAAGKLTSKTFVGDIDSAHDLVVALDALARAVNGWE